MCLPKNIQTKNQAISGICNSKRSVILWSGTLLINHYPVMLQVLFYFKFVRIGSLLPCRSWCSLPGEECFFTLGIFKVLVKKALKPKEIKCISGGCYPNRSPNISVHVSPGWGKAWTPLLLHSVIATHPDFAWHVTNLTRFVVLKGRKSLRFGEDSLGGKREDVCIFAL